RRKSFFFFQAEDGIRDFHVTGVQTCALPICCYCPFLHHGRNGPMYKGEVLYVNHSNAASTTSSHEVFGIVAGGYEACYSTNIARSEERRVGKECRYRGGRGDREMRVENEDVW